MLNDFIQTIEIVKMFIVFELCERPVSFFFYLIYLINENAIKIQNICNIPLN